MYDRRHRLLTQPVNSTAPEVGPGTYQVETVKKKRGSYAPFQSLSIRESFLTVGAQLAVVPAPTHYSPVNEEHIKGGASLNNKADRFQSTYSITPGPGTYVVSKESDWLRKTYPPHRQTEPHQKTFGKLTYKRVPTVPSIPMPGQNYGYDEDEEEAIIPQFSPVRIDRNIGPADYNVSHRDTATTVKYKGVHFYNQRSLRTQFKGIEGPGPGDYQSVVERDQLLPTSPAPHTCASNSLPRYHELVTKQEQKKAIPGPGQYTIKSQFPYNQIHSIQPKHEKEEEEGESEYSQITRAPFGSWQQRFSSPKHMSPACTTYMDSRTAFNDCRPGGGRAPFSQSSLRFRPNREAKQIPGPGAYNNSQMTSMTADLSKQLQFHGTYNCPFGTTSVRTAPLIKRDDYIIPGPAYYQQPESKGGVANGKGGVAGGKVGVVKQLPASYMFASTTSRLYSPPSIVTDIPPPGSYEVSEFKAISHTDPYSRGGLASQGTFLSSTNRFAPPRNILLEKPDEANPGPGEYDCVPALGRGKPGLLCNKDERFKPAKTIAPGPGAYKLSRAVRDTLLYGTHNVSLNNPLASSDSSSENMTRKQTFVVGV